MPGANMSHVVHSGRLWRRRVASEIAEVDAEQQQLGADKGGNHNVDAEVEHSGRIQAGFLRAMDRQLQAEQVRSRQQHAVGVDRKRSNGVREHRKGSELK